MGREYSFRVIKSMVLAAASVSLFVALSGSLAMGQSRPTREDQNKTPVLPVVQDGSATRPGAGTQTIIRKGLVGSPVTGGARTQSFSDAPVNVLISSRSDSISNCAMGSSGITCNLFETDAAGNPSQISSPVTLPSSVIGGFLVLKGNAAAPDSDQSQWSNVLVFGPTSGSATTVQMFSAGCNSGNPSDRSCFPSLATVNTNPNSGFINEAAATVFTAGPNIYRIATINAIAPNRPFTLASSVGTVDEDSAAIVQLRNFTVTLLPGATGSVHIRYDITAVNDISSFCPATQSVVQVRFRNGDNSGATAQVSFDIHSTNITSGGNNIIYSFSSNGRGAGGSFTSITDSPAIDFDFANNIYWIEATVFRSDVNQLADLGSIQIWESAGSACP